MMGLSDGERISMTCSAVLTQITRVTDGRTDGIGVAYTRYSMYAVARKNHQVAEFGVIRRTRGRLRVGTGSSANAEKSRVQRHCVTAINVRS